MTVSIELEPYLEKLLRTVAKERGVSFEEVVALYPDPSEETIEELEDEVDIARAKGILVDSDPSQRKTLDDLRKMLGR